MEKNNLSKNFWIILSIVSLICIIVLTVGIVFFNKRSPKVINKNKTGGNIVLNYVSDVNGLNLTNAIPVSDDFGKKFNKENYFFDFSVDSQIDNANNIDYELSLSVDESLSSIPNDEIRVYLEKEDNGTFNSVLEPTPFIPESKETKLGTKKGDMLIYSSNIKKSKTDNYRLRIWLYEKSKIKKGSYSVSVNIVGKAD